MPPHRRALLCAALALAALCRAFLAPGAQPAAASSAGHGPELQQMNEAEP